MSNSTPLKLCIQIFHETKIRGLNGSISTLFDERMNLNRRHKTQNCAMQGVSHLGERRTMLHDGVERFLFPFIRPSRYSRRAISIFTSCTTATTNRRKKKKKKKDLLASAEIENYRAIFRATPSREDVESSVLEIVMQTK